MFEIIKDAKIKVNKNAFGISSNFCSLFDNKIMIYSKYLNKFIENVGNQELGKSVFAVSHYSFRSKELKELIEVNGLDELDLVIILITDYKYYNKESYYELGFNFIKKNIKSNKPEYSSKELDSNIYIKSKEYIREVDCTDIIEKSLNKFMEKDHECNCKKEKSVGSVEEWDEFAEFMHNYIGERTIDKYSQDKAKTVQVVDILDKRYCLDNIFKYATRMVNGKTKEHDIYKIAHYAQLYWSKCKREK